MNQANISSSGVEQIKELTDKYKDITAEIRKVIIGQDEIIEKLLIGIFSKGHCLLVGVPGLAKTLLVQTLAQVLDLQFSRIQFTPDLMPGDITGSEVLDEQKNFKFLKGPLFANIVLADEINRTPPKTQAALLEAMQEKNVTVGGRVYPLGNPFFVLATQNPIEQEGTYPLPEAQLDRFMFMITLDYPKFRDEVEIVKSTTGATSHTVRKLIGGEQIVAYQNAIRQIPIADNVLEYAVMLVNKTRVNGEHAPEIVKNYIEWGAGPRASQNLVIGAKAHAVFSGKFSPDIEDVKAVAHSVLRHRIVRNFKAEAEGISLDNIIDSLL